jgi:hypothetical protein
MLGLRLFPPMKEATAGSEGERDTYFFPPLFFYLTLLLLLLCIFFFLFTLLFFPERKRRSLPQIFFSLLPDVLLCGTIK